MAIDIHLVYDLHNVYKCEHFIIKFKTLEQKYNSNRNKELDIDIKKKDKKHKFNILLSI